MRDFKEFIYRNDINQKDVIEYLGVSKGYMSLVISGKKKLSEENFRKLLENPYGWDTSMLTDSTENKTPALSSQDTMVDKLLALLAEKDKDMRTMLDILREKDEQINQLRRELDIRKKETASDVADSSFVNVG